MKSTHISPSPSCKALVPQPPPPLHRSAYPQILYLPTCPPTPNRRAYLALLNRLCFHGSGQSIAELQSIVGRCIDLPHFQPSSSPSLVSPSSQWLKKILLLLFVSECSIMGSSESLSQTQRKLVFQNLSEPPIMDSR